MKKKKTQKNFKMLSASCRVWIIPSLVMTCVVLLNKDMGELRLRDQSSRRWSESFVPLKVDDAGRSVNLGVVGFVCIEAGSELLRFPAEIDDQLFTIKFTI